MSHSSHNSPRLSKHLYQRNQINWQVKEVTLSSEWLKVMFGKTSFKQRMFYRNQWTRSCSYNCSIVHQGTSEDWDRSGGLQWDDYEAGGRRWCAKTNADCVLDVDEVSSVKNGCSASQSPTTSCWNSPIDPSDGLCWSGSCNDRSTTRC